MSYCSTDNTYFDGATNSVLIKFVRSALFSDRVTIVDTVKPTIVDTLK